MGLMNTVVLTQTVTIILVPNIKLRFLLSCFHSSALLTAVVGDHVLNTPDPCFSTGISINRQNLTLITSTCLKGKRTRKSVLIIIIVIANV